MDRERIRKGIRDIPDFPKKGIIFKDLVPLMADPCLFHDIIDELASLHKGEKVDAVLGIEARGFLFGAPLALKLGCAFVPVRKKGKLPGKTIQASYALEYGEATIEMHEDSLRPGQRVILLDDLLATGGTVLAAKDLIGRLSAQIISIDFIAELAFLKGRSKITGCAVNSLVVFD